MCTLHHLFRGSGCLYADIVNFYYTFVSEHVRTLRCECFVHMVLSGSLSCVPLRWLHSA